MEWCFLMNKKVIYIYTAEHAADLHNPEIQTTLNEYSCVRLTEEDIKQIKKKRE